MKSSLHHDQQGYAYRRDSPVLEQIIIVVKTRHQDHLAHY